MLPVIPKKRFEVNSKFLPKGKVTLIPFSVGQDQHLKQVKDSTDEKEKIVVLKQIIQECMVTPGVDVGKLPIFIIEEIFLRLLQNSTGEFIPLEYQCKNELNDDKVECNQPIKLDLDLREFKLQEQEGHSNKIIIDDPIGVVFKYPSIDLYEEAQTDLNDELELIIECIDMIFQGENVFPAQDHTREELKAFWNQQTLAQKKNVFDKFFNSMPHMHYEKVIKCPKCGHDHKIEFNSMLEVFT